MLDMPSPREFAAGVIDMKALSPVLLDAGIDPDDVLVLNWVKCRPPRGRMDDHPYAVEACAHWRDAELEDIKPDVLVLMGSHVIKAYFGATATVAKVRGKPLPPGKHGGFPVVATIHPWSAKQDRRLADQLRADLTLAKELAK